LGEDVEDEPQIATPSRGKVTESSGELLMKLLKGLQVDETDDSAEASLSIQGVARTECINGVAAQVTEASVCEASPTSEAHDHESAGQLFATVEPHGCADVPETSEEEEVVAFGAINLEEAEAAAAAAIAAAEAAEAAEIDDDAEAEFPLEAEVAELAEDQAEFFQFSKEIEEVEKVKSPTSNSGLTFVAGGTAAEIEASLGVVPSNAEGTNASANSGKLLLHLIKGTRAAPMPGAAGVLPAVLNQDRWEPLLGPFCNVNDPKHFAGAHAFGENGTPVAGRGDQPVVLKDLPDAGLMLMYKPSGWATCSTPQWEGVEGNLIRFVWQRFPLRGQNAAPCHRLDRGTSGIVFVSTDKNSLRHIATQITSRTLVKQYIGLCRGRIDPPQGALSVPLAISSADKPLCACATEGRTAVTRYRVLGYFRRVEYDGAYESAGSSDMIYSLVQVQIDHGRQHQIRLHMASINHPIVFDAKYSSNCLREDARVCTRLFLHAAYVQCTLPPEGAETLKLACRLPAQLKATLTQFLKRDRNLEDSLMPEATSLCDCLLEPDGVGESSFQVRMFTRRRDEFLHSYSFSRAEREEVLQILSRLPTAEERTTALARFRVLGDRTTDFIVTRFEKYVEGLLKQKHQGSKVSGVEDSALLDKAPVDMPAAVSDNEGGYGEVRTHTENIICEVCGYEEKVERCDFPKLNLRLLCRLGTGHTGPMNAQLAGLLERATAAHKRKVCNGEAQAPLRIPPPPPPGPPSQGDDIISRLIAKQGGQEASWKANTTWHENGREAHWLNDMRDTYPEEHPAEDNEDHWASWKGTSWAKEAKDSWAKEAKDIEQPQDDGKAKLGKELVKFIKDHGNYVNGPVLASEFAARYNAHVRGDSKRNDGSFRKWIGDLPGVSVEHCGGNRWKVHYTAIKLQ
jgi:23S rRNA pseudouridine1911/1915/1917 synthase